jgi:cytochrome c-type biogenesis protein CcmE
MDINWFEIVVTAFGVVLMMYFREIKNDVKTMSGSMTDMNIKLSTVITKHDNTEYVAKKNSEELDKARERLHSLEGGQAQLLVWLESQKNN